jgi:hypothetical protein
MSFFQKFALYSGLGGLMLALSGCILPPPLPPRPYFPSVVVTQPRVAVDVDVEYVQVAPPAPYSEVVTVSPGVGYVWLPGLWFWAGDRYQWRGGAWSRPPSGYNQWNRGGWHHQPGRGWHRSGGHWR